MPQTPRLTTADMAWSKLAESKDALGDAQDWANPSVQVILGTSIALGLHALTTAVLALVEEKEKE